MDARFVNDIRGQIYDTGVNACIPWACIQTATWAGGDPNPGCAFFINFAALVLLIKLVVFIRYLVIKLRRNYYLCFRYYIERVRSGVFSKPFIQLKPQSLS